MPSTKNPFAVAKEMMQKNAIKSEAAEVTKVSEPNDQPDAFRRAPTEKDSDQPAISDAAAAQSDTAAAQEKAGKSDEEEIPENIAKLLAGPKSKKSHMVPMLLDFALKEIKDRENSAMKARGEKGTKKTEDDYVVQAMIEFFSAPGLRTDCLKSAAKKLKSIL